MKTLIILLTLTLSAVSNELSELRKLYPKAASNKENTEAFYNKAFKLTSDDPIAMGYKGVAYTLKAKFDSALLKKKENFIKGVELLEASIAKMPENVELRVLRMSVQENSPKFLNYNENLEEDKKLILKNFSSSKEEVKTFTLHFVGTSKLFSEEEKNSLK